MTSFSSLISSIGEKPQTPRPNPRSSQIGGSTRPVTASSTAPDRLKLSALNTTVGLKRKADAISPTTSQSAIYASSSSPEKRIPVNGRFQLTSTSKSFGRTPARAPRADDISDSASRRLANQQARPKEPSTQPITNNGHRNPTLPTPTTSRVSDQVLAPKKGFASILEKAKAAQAASQSSGSGGIKHKPVERIPRRERVRLNEEAKALQKQKDKLTRKSTINGNIKTRLPAEPTNHPPNVSYKGTMKPARDISYKGTMRPGQEGKAAPKKPQKGMGQDKYGGYASWSDLDDVEDGDEERYGSSESEDMEGGFDDLEHEEATALREARREDQAAIEEEEKLRREKLARKRKLEQMNKAAAARRKY